MSANEDKFTILVVDDSRTVRASINKVLRERYTIVQAEDGRMAGINLLNIRK